MKACVLAVSLLAIAGPVAAAAPSDGANGAPPSQDACPGAAPTRTADAPSARGPLGQWKRLDQLPPAQQYLTVLKSVGGCGVAVVKVGDRTFDVPQGGPRQVTPLGVPRHRR